MLYRLGETGVSFTALIASLGFNFSKGISITSPSELLLIFIPF